MAQGWYEIGPEMAGNGKSAVGSRATLSDQPDHSAHKIHSAQIFQIVRMRGSAQRFQISPIDYRRLLTSRPIYFLSAIPLPGSYFGTVEIVL